MGFLKDYIDFFIFGILGAMSFLALWFSVERVLFYRQIERHAKGFAAFESLESLEEALTKNLTTLYIIYSNAPYIGLLGTVVGIMVTFHDIGSSGSLEAGSIMVGLSLALKATALGLLVAIPTLMAYNAFLRKVDVLLNAYKIRTARAKNAQISAQN